MSVPDLSFYTNPSTLKLLRTRKILLDEETPCQLFTRVVQALLNVEDYFQTPGFEKEVLKKHVFQTIEQRHIVFGSPLLTNAGREHMPISSCTVIPVDLQKSLEEIKKTMLPYYQAEMGSGFNLSEIADPVKTLRELNHILLEIEGTVKRPPCGMALLMVDHPQVLNFINMKREDDFASWRFNLSVGVTNVFMEAVQHDEEWTFNDQTKVPAKIIFEAIAAGAHHCGEPGLIFFDHFQEDNPLPSLVYKSVAPCAEIAMAPGEVCQFSYINVAAMVQDLPDSSASFDFKTLQHTAALLTRLLDDGVEISIANAVSDAAIIADKRRISIGICGFADLLIKLKMQYGSDESLILLKEILSVVQYYSKKASVELAASRGPFPAFGQSRYCDYGWVSRFQAYPTEQVSSEMWQTLASRITQIGIRNAGTTALPPTGVSSRIIHTSQSIEPLFSLLEDSFCLRRDLQTELIDIFQSANVDAERQTAIFKEITDKGTIPEEMLEIPDQIKKTFLTASQIAWESHLRILGEAKNYLDESVSKTVLLPKITPATTVKKCFLQAYRIKLKGITIFRNGCLQEKDKSIFAVD